VILEADAPALEADEEALAVGRSEARRRELALGRAALREALGQAVAILADDRGAPRLPAGWVGSISHKGTRAAAIAAPSGEGFVGVDLERAVPSRFGIERRILTERERAGVEGARVTLRFAIKEAIYKAVDPIVRRYVGFTEVELAVGDAGACAVSVVDPAALPVVIEAWWCERDGFWLATARARRL
jgi:4'-phosphopantetheinyl transferase EntD